MLNAKRTRSILYICSFLVAAGAMSCSSADSSKANLASSERESSRNISNRKQTASAIRNAQTQSPSSLDALRRGQSPTTAPGSALKEIYFDFDRYELSDAARVTLRASAVWLKDNPSARVEIEGHCDERGTNEYNLALGAKRAQAAKDYLITLGISAGRLSTISYGEEIAVCHDPNENCWQRNRRDRFVALGQKGGV